MSKILTQLDAAIDRLVPQLTELRHDLHAHPQLSFHETYASAKVQEHLAKANIPFKAGLAKTGVVGWLSGKNANQPAVALRADMDALPITEQTNLPYAASGEFHGKMHACGHDGHTTMLIGAATALAQHRDLLPHPITFVFQPAEEGGAGAARMVKDGALTDRVGPHPVGRIFGLHGWPRVAFGQVATRVGSMMAGVDTLHITLRSTGGHAAFPHLTPDPIHAGAQLVAALQSVVSRNVNPVKPAVLTITMFHGGTTDNVIPDIVQLCGTIRTVDQPTRQLVHRRITELMNTLPGAFDCRGEVRIETGYPPTVNDATAAGAARSAIVDLLGNDGFLDMEEPVMGAEDFSFYGQHVPACFCFLGTQRPQNQPQITDLHTPLYDFNDEALAVGMKLLVRMAVMGDE